MDVNGAGRPSDQQGSLKTSQPEPKPRKISLKIVALIVVGSCVLLQGFVYTPKLPLLYPPRPKNNSRIQNKTVQFEGVLSTSDKIVRVLIFGSKKQLSQRINFLQELDGVWQHRFSCGEDTQIVVRVGGNKIDFMNQDAVVFNMDQVAVTRNKKMLASMMSSFPKQAWLYYGRESAIHMRWFNGAHYDGSLPLHGVWSYHRASEVLMRYGYFVPEEPATNGSQSGGEWLRGKTKLVAWVARNCHRTFWPRTEYVASLRKHISVDTYGACGNLTCPFQPHAECVRILKQYKFYLALENAECDDYATEKLWETAYTNGIVPVVYGAQREYYVQEAPPDSFIYAGDFGSTKELAEFLLHLDKNPDLYAKYFNWRLKGHIELAKKANHPLQSGLFCSLLPFIDKVQKSGAERNPISEHPYYSSCANLKGRSVTFLPKTQRNLGSWKPRKQ